MTGCAIHINFFDDTCSECKKEYAELKGLNEAHSDNDNKSTTYKNLEKKYKEFSEERAKKLYEDLLLHFLGVITMKLMLRRKLELSLENSAIYEVCHIGLGFNPIPRQLVSLC